MSRPKSSKKSPARKKKKNPEAESRPRLGLAAAVEHTVLREWTLAHFDPRLPAVFSTPAMIGLMEHAAAQAVMGDLPPGAITVGTRIEVDHLKAVPEGAQVQASARLKKYKKRFLVFEVEARSGEHVIGRGFVYRAIVEPQGFHSRARARKS
ncbi:MAG TPA: hotdog domain-containing protein [Candidatus Limnocylindrales bacterium]|jgi:fluoroacetyl-CoA thioesterase|nr:hotdog domain-containing protein [Candidatus Limnocylindrales bacterium]